MQGINRTKKLREVSHPAQDESARKPDAFSEDYRGIVELDFHLGIHKVLKLDQLVAIISRKHVAFQDTAEVAVYDSKQNHTGIKVVVLIFLQAQEVIQEGNKGS